MAMFIQFHTEKLTGNYFNIQYYHIFFDIITYYMVELIPPYIYSLQQHIVCHVN